ncbi:hypothetical protein TNCV_505831 [Trichonephila clavipes]|nr:hypothetical protein TNCV_505831 [Trichonephila clavipes]
MITNFFIPELNNHDVQELWFQQDGATYHTARATIDLLKDTLGDRLISHFGPVNWPPRFCDLTPLDYFLARVPRTARGTHFRAKSLSGGATAPIPWFSASDYKRKPIFAILGCVNPRSPHVVVIPCAEP